MRVYWITEQIEKTFGWEYDNKLITSPRTHVNLNEFDILCHTFGFNSLEFEKLYNKEHILNGPILRHVARHAFQYGLRISLLNAHATTTS